MEISRMKKSLLAIAATTAFAGAAQAQSSVTVYGTLDAAITRVDNGATATNGVTNALSGSTQVTDRLGFRGVEDLGGGTKALFTLELEITPMAANGGTGGRGNGDAMRSDAPGSMFNNRRPSFVGLEDAKLGKIQAGSMFSQGFLFTGFGAADGFNQLGTNLSHATVVSSATQIAGNQTIGVSDTSFKQNSNTLQYTSPTFAGFNAEISNTFAAAGTTSGAAVGAGRVVGATVNYTFGKLNLKAMMEKKTVIAAGPNTVHTSTGFGGSYDFGIAKVNATVQKGALDSTNSAGARSETGIVTVSKLSFIAPATPQIDIFGGYALLSENAAGTLYSTSGTQGKATMYNIGAQYKLSKRTALYGSYAALSNDSTGSKFALGTAAGTADKNPNLFALGMRHSF